MKANIGLTDKSKAAVAVLLNLLLADEHILYTKTRNYHWNYEGDNFMEMHKFYEAQYDELAEMIDEIAERIRMLGHFPEGRLRDFVRLTRLTEQEYTTDQAEQLKNLLGDHESIITNTRKAIEKTDKTYKDAGTTDFITGIMQQHEKMAWMIRSYL
ncbi:MAG TPA: DNA starvation/stationary phase protection protein [Chitinophagaceae bacterium]